MNKTKSRALAPEQFVVIVLCAMNRDINPYSAPNHASSLYGADAIKRFFGRSIVAGLLAATTLSTGLFLLWLDSIGAIDLGRFGVVALASLLFATIALLVAVRFYSRGSRKFAVTFLVVGMLCFVPIVLIALHEAGIF